MIHQIIRDYFKDKVADVWCLEDIEDDYEFNPEEGASFLRYWHRHNSVSPGLSLETLEEAAEEFGLKRKSKQPPPPKESNN